MGVGKAIIVTDNKAFVCNIEGAGIGILVDYYNREGWEKPINYSINNPEKAKNMGRKRQKLSRKRYNYFTFSGEIYKASECFTNEIFIHRFLKLIK